MSECRNCEENLNEMLKSGVGEMHQHQFLQTDCGFTAFLAF